MPRTAAVTNKKTTATKTPAKTAAKKPTAKTTTTRTRRAVEVEEKPTRARKGAAPAAKKPTTATTRKAAPQKTPTRPTRTRVAAPVEPTPVTGRDMDELTGFVVGSDVHVVAVELMAGGADRQEIIDRVRTKLDTETRTGTPKPVANIVGAVMRKLEERGFVIESSFVMLPPAPVVKKSSARTRRG